MAEAEEVAQEDVVVSPESEEAAIRAEGLTKRYGDTLVFRDLDLEVKEGEILCLLGPSGCGKTTLLHIMAGLEEASSGTVWFQGEAVDGPDYRRGVVFQDPLLYPWLTVRENIAFGPDVRGESIDNGKVDDLLSLIGLEEFADATPAELSGGMAQRVSLARTLANDPEVLLLDEPTSALDAITQRGLQDELLRIMRSLELTAVYVTHDIEEAVYLGDRVAVLSDRPSEIVGVEEVSRDINDRGSDEFVEKRSQVFDLLETNGGKG